MAEMYSRKCIFQVLLRISKYKQKFLLLNVSEICPNVK